MYIYAKLNWHQIYIYIHIHVYIVPPLSQMALPRLNDMHTHELISDTSEIEWNGIFTICRLILEGSGILFCLKSI